MRRGTGSYPTLKVPSPAASGFILLKARIGAIASSSCSTGAVPLSVMLPQGFVFLTLFPIWKVYVPASRTQQDLYPAAPLSS